MTITIEFMAELGKALRFNEGKLRYDLLPIDPLKEIAKVFTFGAEKYDDNNWRSGMPWSKCIASLERHIAAIKAGEDYDPESGIYHAAHAATNLIFLLEYYKTFPMGDDRYQKPKFKIGLDIDEVLCGWVDGYKLRYNLPVEYEPKSWYLHYDVIKHCKEDLGCDWYLGLQPLIKPEDIPFEPHCYITSRNIPSETTMTWLHNHGYPTRPVHTVGLAESKAEVAKREGVEIFVDDVYKNFCELNENGVFCYLLDRPHNRRFNVGHKRIYNLKELA